MAIIHRKNSQLTANSSCRFISSVSCVSLNDFSLATVSSSSSHTFVRQRRKGLSSNRVISMLNYNSISSTETELPQGLQDQSISC